MIERAVLLVTCALGLSCATLARAPFEVPEVSLVEIQILGIGLTGGTLNLVLDVRNPNPYELRSTRMDATVDLEETRFGEIRFERPVRLPPEQSTFVEIPLRFTWEGVGAGARAFLTQGTAAYTLEGRLYANTPFGERPVPLRTGGTVTLRDLM